MFFLIFNYYHVSTAGCRSPWSVHCLIILRNYQLVYTWPLIFINIDNERVEASWLASSTMYIVLNILIS